MICACVCVYLKKFLGRGSLVRFHCCTQVDKVLTVVRDLVWILQLRPSLGGNKIECLVDLHVYHKSRRDMRIRSAQQTFL